MTEGTAKNPTPSRGGSVRYTELLAIVDGMRVTTFAEWDTIDHLRHCPEPHSPEDLADHRGMHSIRAAAALDSLANAGLLQESDGRYWLRGATLARMADVFAAYDTDVDFRIALSEHFRLHLTQLGDSEY